MQPNPLLRKAQADNILERAALQLQALLKEACAELDPFPPFPNALFTNAIECDAGASVDPDRGCVVVCEDGELYELEFGIDHDSIELTGSWDPVTARKETQKKLELLPRDYLVYAYNGLIAVTEALLERAEAEDGKVKQLFKLLVILGLIGAGVAIALRYLNDRRSEAAPEPWTPPPRPDDSIVPDEIVSIVDEPISAEVAEEIAAADTDEAAEPAAHHDAALDFVPDDGSGRSVEEVEEGASMVVEVVEPEAVPSTFDPEHQTPDEDFQLAENEAGIEATEEVEHGAEMTVEVIEAVEAEHVAAAADESEEAAELERSAEVLRELEQAEPEPEFETSPAAGEGPPSMSAASEDAAAQVERGAELTAEVLGTDAPAPSEMPAPEYEPAAVEPEEVLVAERDDAIPVQSAEVTADEPVAEPTPEVEAQPDDFLTKAFLELAATPETETESAAPTTPETPVEPPIEEAPPAPAWVAEEEPAEATAAAEPEAPAENPAETSSADWIPAEERAFEPLSTGVESAHDLALADTLEEAIGDLGPGAITPRPARNAESFLDEGNVYFNVGQYALAIERYTRALELDDTLTAAHYNRANARTRAGEFDGALADYDQALNLAPNDADALNNRGMLHLYRQNYAAALRDFNAALAEDPADTTVMVNRGLAHLHGGDPIRAVEDFREATSLDPGDAAAHYGAAQASAALSRRDEALRSIERALAIDPGYAREAAADPRLAILQGDEQFMRLLRESGTRT